MTRTRLNSRSTRLHLEHLEDRSVPATFNVTTKLDVVNGTDGKLSLREAITKANTTVGADVIVVPAGVFKLTLGGAGENANATGDFDVTDTVTIRGAGKGLTIIDGQQADRVFDVFGTAPGSIKGVFEALTVRNGSATGFGGGIQVGNANLVVRDSAVTDNRASQAGGGISNGAASGTGSVALVRATVARNTAASSGGGVNVLGGNGSPLTVTSSTVRRNLAGTRGGGISVDTMTMTNSIVSGNSAESSGGGINADTATLTNCAVSGNSAVTSGGGINSFTVTLTSCTVSGNSAVTIGGGIRADTTMTMTNSTVSGNSAGSNGGGILAGTATLTRSTVSGNSAVTDGGGINAFTATLTNCTVSGNSAHNQGGGLTILDGATILNSTIVENSAALGGGVFRAPTATHAVQVRNSLIALNFVSFAGTDADLNGTFVSQGHNLIGDGTGGSGFTNDVKGDLVGSTSNLIDPKIGDLASNGGPTKTHALLAGSPAIDKGDNASLPVADQRGAGFPRKKDGDGNGSAIVDIGAFEL